MTCKLSMTLLAVLVATTVVRADPGQLERELESDVVLRALVDELQRSMGNLALEDLERPYFIEYALLDNAFDVVAAQFGDVTRRGSARRRPLRSDVRVGSYELDNTNFSSGGRYPSGGADMPVENDYDAIRQSIWWTTDVDYKGVAEDIVRKRAFMESKLIEDKPNDFSREEPAIYFEDRKGLEIDVGPLEDYVVKLSAVFKDYPAIHESSAQGAHFVANGYLVNTEGTRMRTAMELYIIAISASVQADDGMELGDSLKFQALAYSELPPVDEMVADCREMADRLLKLKDAPVLESYSGPVLFEPSAAANIFARRMAGRFRGGQRNVGSGTDPDDFANKLGKRVLPKTVNVVDDPTLKTVAGTRAFGHYAFDDQGVCAQRVTLVEEGRLKALLMSRNPSKEFDRSNGHGRGLYQATAGPGNLIVSSTDPSSAKELREELIESAADEDLEFAIRIESLGSVSGGQRFGRYGGGISGGTDPLFIYKVYSDGHEELVRGARLSDLTPKTFKKMLAVGGEPYVLNLGSSSGAALTTIAVPALLFEELDLAKIDRDFDKPPILPPPLARGQEQAE